MALFPRDRISAIWLYFFVVGSDANTVEISHILHSYLPVCPLLWVFDDETVASLFLAFFLSILMTVAAADHEDIYRTTWITSGKDNRNPTLAPNETSASNRQTSRQRGPAVGQIKTACSRFGKPPACLPDCIGCLPAQNQASKPYCDYFSEIPTGLIRKLYTNEIRSKCE